MSGEGVHLPALEEARSAPSDEDWSSRPTASLLARWARRLGRLLIASGRLLVGLGWAWESSAPGPALPLSPLAPQQSKRLVHACVSAFNPDFHSLFFSNTLGTPGPRCSPGGSEASEPRGPEVVKGLCSPPGDRSSHQRNQIASLRVIFFLQ